MATLYCVRCADLYATLQQAVVLLAESIVQKHDWHVLRERDALKHDCWQAFAAHVNRCKNVDAYLGFLAQDDNIQQRYKIAVDEPFVRMTEKRLLARQMTWEAKHQQKSA